MDLPTPRPVLPIQQGKPESTPATAYQCLFRCIFEQAGVGVAEVDLETLQIRRINAELARLVGRPGEDLSGTLFTSLGAVLEQASAKLGTEAMHFGRLRQGANKNSYWYASYQLSGEQQRSVKVTASLLADPTQAPRSCIVVLDDISEQKLAERKLTELSQQLEQRVIERTAALSALNESMQFQIAERKRTEEALRQSVALYRTIAASIPDAAVLVVNQDMRYRVAEGLLLNLLGTSRDKLEGTYVGRAEHGQTGQTFLEIFRQAVSGKTASCERRCEDRLLYMLYTPLRDNECEIIGAVILAIDISAQKRSEEDRIRLEQQYLQLVETASEGIWIVDRDFQTTFANEQMAALLGCERELLLGAKISHFVFPEDLAEFQTRMQTRRLGRDERYEARFRRKDGSACWLQTTAKALMNDRGEFLGAFGMLTDVSQRRETEELLRASETRFRAIIEASTEGILVFSIDSRTIRYANPKACEMLRFSLEELAGHKLEELASPVSRQRFGQSIPSFMADTGEFRRKDGSALHVGIKTVVLDLKGEQCMVLFLTDLTARSLLEQERIKVQKLDAIGTLAGGIAHDFNNLLQAIYANISMARWSYDNREESLRRLESVEHSLHLAIKLTRQLLGFSKGATLQKRRIVLGPLIEEATSFILSGAKASCEISIDPALWATEVDEGQIHQVIYNVVLNADQSMPLGGNICVVARNVTTPAEGLPPLLSPGRWVSVTVRDTGVGIAEENMNRIFDPYFSTKSTGNGLGLATTYAVIRKHGGYIDVKSTVGEGTTVTIFLPASDSIEQVAPEECPSDSKKVLRVLLLDDDENVLTTSQALLQVLGHTVVSVKNGEAAIASYQEAISHGKAFDLVLLDVTIRGGMGGIETLHRLRALHPKVTAILTSGYSDESLAPGDLPSQARLFLPKPYTLEQLRDAIQFASPDTASNE